MGLRVRARPEVEADVRDAIEWYAQRVPELGSEFHRAFLDLVEQVADAPEATGVSVGNVRRAVFRRFPYLLFYAVETHEVVLLACVHERRSPDSWPT